MHEKSKRNDANLRCARRTEERDKIVLSDESHPSSSQILPSSITMKPSLLLSLRRFSTSSPPPPPLSTSAPTLTRGKIWFRRTAILASAWFALFALDTQLNDDWDVVLFDKFRRRLALEEQKQRPRVVILGSGWGALSMLRKLHTDQFQVTVVSPKNYFLFTPLLASTTVGTLHQRSVVEPIRQFFSRSDAMEAKFIEAECTDIDFVNNKITCIDNSVVNGEVSKFNVDYDHLIIAVGCETATFGIPGVKEHALFMKEIKHSYQIRDRILDSLETANIPGQPQEEIDRLLHFVVVGGGPSGIEFSGELHDFLKRDIQKNYPEQSKYVKLTLIEALPHILTMFDANLINKVEETLKNKLNIELLLNAAVKKIGEKTITVQSKNKGQDEGKEWEIPYGVLVWVTGNTPLKLIKDCIEKLQQKNEKRGLLVDDHFRVKGTNNVWAIGDCSISKYPPTAQVAYQEGSYLGRLFNSLSEDFRSKDLSSLHDSISIKQKFEYRHFGKVSSLILLLFLSPR